MNPDTLNTSVASTAVRRKHRDVNECRALAEQVIHEWKNGAAVDAQAALAQHSALAEHRTVVMDLLYEEYCLRSENGESVSVSEFCARFPDYQQSFRNQIEVHRMAADCPHLGSILTASLQAGDVLAGYTLVEQLGRGAFATVYLARDGTLGGRHCVIKISPDGEDEAQTQGRLEHANIVPVLSVRKESGLSVLCMPFWGRCTLESILNKVRCGKNRPRRAQVLLEIIQGEERIGQTTPDEPPAEGAGAEQATTTVGDPAATHEKRPHAVLRRGSYVDGVLHLGQQLADALETAHAAGVLHLDLKPSNVLITPSGVPKLLDFNVSRDQLRTKSRTGGTLPYMAPEQLGVFFEPDAAKLVNGRADVFALGLILYQLLCGELPFGELPDRKKTLEVALDRIDQQRKGPRPIRALNADIDRGVAKLIQRCLAFDRRERFQTAGELADALRQQLRWRRRALRWVTSHPKVSWAIGLTAATLVTVALTLFATADPPYVTAFKAGRAAYLRGDDDRAIVLLDRALTAKPDHIEAALVRARAHGRNGDPEPACRGLRKYIRLTPDPDPRAWAMLRYCQNKCVTNWVAMDSYEQAIQEGFESAALYNNLGYSYLKVNRLNEAVRHLRRAIELDERLRVAWYNRALAELRLAQEDERVPDRAIADIEQAIALDG